LNAIPARLTAALGTAMPDARARNIQATIVNAIVSAAAMVAAQIQPTRPLREKRVDRIGR